MTDLPCATTDDGYCLRHGVEHALESRASCGDTCGGVGGCEGTCHSDLPEAFQPRSINPWEGRDSMLRREGYNLCLQHTKAAALLEALRAAFPACVGYDGPGHIQAHNTARLALLEHGITPDGIESTDPLHPEAAAYRDERHALQRERDGLRDALQGILTGTLYDLSPDMAERFIREIEETARGKA